MKNPKDPKEKFWCNFCGLEHTGFPMVEWKSKDTYYSYRFCTRECADKYTQRYGKPRRNAF